jgi:uncharacterized protein involved in exopolysaccharide biosynthesis
MQMTTTDKNANEKILRDAFRTMDPHQAQEIREAYYKAVEGLRTLADMPRDRRRRATTNRRPAP